LNGQSIGNAIYGLQSMNSECEEVSDDWTPHMIRNPNANAITILTVKTCWYDWP
jgi:hypothetical protein